MFLSSWKYSSVVPISGILEKTPTLKSYRHISLLLLFGKVLESLINADVVKQLNSHDLLSDNQNSIHLDDVLTFITEFVYRALDKNGEARDVFLDSSMPFDIFCHACLLRKPQSYSAEDVCLI